MKLLFAAFVALGSLVALHEHGEFADGEICIGADRLEAEHQLEQAEQAYIALLSASATSTEDLECARQGLARTQDELCARAQRLANSAQSAAAQGLALRLSVNSSVPCHTEQPASTTSTTSSQRSLSARIELELEEPTEWAMECQGPDAIARAVIEGPGGARSETEAHLLAPEPDGHTIGCPPVTLSVSLDELTAPVPTTTPGTTATTQDAAKGSTSTSSRESQIAPDALFEEETRSEDPNRVESEVYLPAAQTFRGRIERGATLLTSDTFGVALSPGTFWPLWALLVGLLVGSFVRWHNRTRDPGLIGDVEIEDGTADKGSGIVARAAFRQTAGDLGLKRVPIEGGALSPTEGLLGGLSDGGLLGAAIMSIAATATSRAVYAVQGTANKKGLTLEVDGPELSTTRSFAYESAPNLEEIEVAAARGAAALVYQSRLRTGQVPKTEDEFMAEAVAQLVMRRD